jgi:hypothetical protein
VGIEEVRAEKAVTRKFPGLVSQLVVPAGVLAKGASAALEGVRKYMETGTQPAALADR